MTTKRKCITKADLAATIYDAAIGLDKDQSTAIVEDYIELIKCGLEEDGKVLLSGFGSYEVREKAARRGLNPQNLQPLQLRPRRVVKFKPSTDLKKRVNAGPVQEEDDDKKQPSP